MKYFAGGPTFLKLSGGDVHRLSHGKNSYNTAARPINVFELNYLIDDTGFRTGFFFSGQFTMVLNTAIETFNENSAHLVFTAQDGQNYALITDLKNGTVSFTVSINTCNFKGNQGEINECLSNSDFIKSDSLV